MLSSKAGKNFLFLYLGIIYTVFSLWENKNKHNYAYTYRTFNGFPNSIKLCPNF